MEVYKRILGEQLHSHVGTEVHLLGRLADSDTLLLEQDRRVTLVSASEEIRQILNCLERESFVEVRGKAVSGEEVQVMSVNGLEQNKVQESSYQEMLRLTSQNKYSDLF